MKRSTPALVLLAVATAAALPAQAAQADGSSLASKGKAAKESAGTLPPQILYSLSNDSRSEVDRLDPASGATKKIASSTGDLTAAAWSAATSRYYYEHLVESGTDGDAVDEADMLAEAGGAPSAAVKPAVDFDISPDGSTYVYSDETGNLFKVPAAGSTPTRLTGAGGVKPRFSPDGTRIVFTRVVKDNFDVYTIGTDGTGLKRITAAGNVDFSGVFSPTGTRLMFTRLSGADSDVSTVYSVDTSGKNLRKVADDAADPDWAANGWISYLALDDNGIAQVAVRSPGVPGDEQLLTNNGLDAGSVRFRSGAAPAAGATPTPTETATPL